MAKRFPAFKEFGRSTKKPKLDVSVNKGRPLGPSQSCPHHIRGNAAAIQQIDSPVRNSISNNNLWDDDDDDVILLATQVAESQVANKIAAAQNNITDSEITFSEFAPHVHATTSTQRLTTTITTCAPLKSTVSAPPTTMLPDKNSLSALFADDDDFAEILIEATNDKIVQNTMGAQQKDFEKVDIFKKPIANGWNNNAPMASSGTYTQESQNTAARRQVASERQVKLLMERLDALKAENAKLTKDLTESKSKIESKDGESTLLRDELRHMKQQMQTLKMEKLMSTEAAKSECKTKLAELSKRVEAKESELKLRNAEYSVLKMRHADETQRLEMSIRNANVFADAPMEIDVPEKPQYSRSKNHMLYRLRGLNLAVSSAGVSGGIGLSASAYERTQERGATRQRQHTPFQQELTNAQTLLAQLQIQHQKRLWTYYEALAFSERAIASASSALPEFWTYVHGLEFPKHCNVHPYHDYELRKDVGQHQRDLHAAHALHEDERAISLRRYIAALSVMCAQAPNFGQKLLKQQHGDYTLLEVACQAISKLGYSREICAHFGTLEAFAALLRVLLQQFRTRAEGADEDIPELLVGGLLKQLIFVRPSAWIFRELSYCVLELTRLPTALALLCVNSDESTFYSDRMRSLYRFSNDSCILQVYAGLLEIAFPLNGVLSETHLRLLAVICENHVRFAHFCFMKPPDFIHKLLPSYDDDDDDDDDDDTEGDDDNTQLVMGEHTTEQQCNAESVVTINSSAATTTTGSSGATAAARCECYTKLCLSVVTLLFQLLRQWQCTGRNIETPRVAEVSQISVQLLYTIFCDNYSTRLFRYAEETTKHYLWLICEWWSENAELLKFNNVHKNFLNKLRTFHIMPKQLKDDGNTANLMNDLNEWHSLTNDSTTTTTADATANLMQAAEKLNLMRCAGDESKFFEGLKGYAFNFE